MAKDDDRPLGILEEMTLDDVRRFRAEVVVVGIGSTEPHGPHLPYATDTIQAEGLCREAVLRANRAGARALMYPTLPISTNANMKAFPFAGRVKVRTFIETIIDIIEALEADGIRKIVLVNGHGGNRDVLRLALREYVDRRGPQEGAFVCLTSTSDALGGAKREAEIIEHRSEHAGEAETSKVMYHRPDLVREDKLADFPRVQPALKQLDASKAFFVRSWDSYLPESAGGETRKSSAEKGERYLDQTAGWLADLLVELTETPWHPRFPYAPE